MATKKTKWDLPLLNGADLTNEALNVLAPDLYFREAEKMLRNTLKMEGFWRVAALRESCGVKPEMVAVNVRRPPHYGS